MPVGVPGLVCTPNASQRRSSRSCRRQTPGLSPPGQPPKPPWETRRASVRPPRIVTVWSDCVPGRKRAPDPPSPAAHRRARCARKVLSPRVRNCPDPHDPASRHRNQCSCPRHHPRRSCPVAAVFRPTQPLAWTACNPESERKIGWAPSRNARSEPATAVGLSGPARSTATAHRHLSCRRRPRSLWDSMM